ncbi:MAG: spore germination protein [Firmicutes bacterium HGW-Firmicutes-14]|nr:MAG: spore germination protein [Firmicutes bacterium HGW-Firmicutes-14]
MLDFFRKKKHISIDKTAMSGEGNNKPCMEGEITQVPLIDVTSRDLQQTLRGTKARFSENIDYNISILTHRLPSRELLCQRFHIGTLSQTRVVMVYLGDTANPGIVSEIKDRIGAIKTKTVMDSIYIERNIEDSHISPFPQVETSQRPDVTESALLQGRIAVFVDGSPDVILAPTTFFDLMDTPDDAYMRWPVAASFYRAARYIMFLIAASLPALYVALTSYNPEMFPTKLLWLIVASREETPFPIYIEAFIMMGIIEAIRMMMIRIPTQVGATIALLSGITLVIAGIFSNFIGAGVVVIATLSMISSFGIPNFDLRISIRIIQFFTVSMATLFGIFGFAVSAFAIGAHMASLKSFGIPFMAPLAPLEPSGWGHTVFRQSSETMPLDETYKPLPAKGDFDEG